MPTVCIKTHTGQTFRIDIGANDTVMILRQKIEANGCQTAGMSLYANGKKCENGMTMNYYKVTEFNTIVMCPRMPGVNQLSSINFVVNMALQRIQQDLIEIARKPPALCTAGPDGDNMFEWNATMIGPTGTPYEGGHFRLRIQFPSNYPTNAPTITFVTKIFHPNIGECGGICSSLLGSYWTPNWTIADLLSAISGFLNDPNPDSSLNKEAAKLYKDARSQFNDMARQWTRQFAHSN